MLVLGCNLAPGKRCGKTNNKIHIHIIKILLIAMHSFKPVCQVKEWCDEINLQQQNLTTSNVANYYAPQSMQCL